jgi:hypothetical protein
MAGALVVRRKVRVVSSFIHLVASARQSMKASGATHCPDTLLGLRCIQAAVRIKSKPYVS